MKRKLLTQRFPFLLPLRQWQRKRLYYFKMALDGNRYASRKSAPLPYELARAKSLLINERTGMDIKYQRNKAHNLRLASRAVSNTLIRPGETFSLWWLARRADKLEPYKDGLCVICGKLTAVYGGGLCQLSNTLFWLFLHTPLTIVERHMHGVKEFPNPSPDDPCGVDATILEGWLDLRVRNDTGETLQVELSQDDEYYYGRILAPNEPENRYDVVNENLRYFKRDGGTFESVDVIRRTIRARNGEIINREKLYTNVTEIGYPMQAAPEEGLIPK
ncbi:MAG: glycopeptide resistance accessory protein VanW [Oscillospiraceae bacterium]|jgi:vancomycin resistance protein VanW|nr:glycopeptide resistance accessory protein VanW [Oscillospiraceae bacterium]